MFCNLAKEFLSQHEIEYTDRNVGEEEDALAELKTLGYMTTPVIVIDGDLVVGFDRERLEELLQISLKG